MKGILAINFFEIVNQLLIKDMTTMVVIKFLDCSIGHNALQNRINSLWRPSSPFHLMDIENRYFLVKLQNKEDFENVVSRTLDYIWAIPH